MKIYSFLAKTQRRKGFFFAGLAGMDAGQGRKQAVPAHPAPTAFVHPCTADAEALRLGERYD